MIAYYHHKGWQTGAPYEKYEAADIDWPKPLYRPGWWVSFYDVTVADLGVIVGCVEFVTKIDNRSTFEIKVGYTRHSVTKKYIRARMIEDVQDV